MKDKFMYTYEMERAGLGYFLLQKKSFGRWCFYNVFRYLIGKNLYGRDFETCNTFLVVVVVAAAAPAGGRAGGSRGRARGGNPPTIMI